MTSGAAQAAWNNVFQVCCHNCRSSAYVAAPAPVAAAVPAPCGGCQQCTTRYVQRCYYQPVTCYRQSCYMEPVTTYRTSYYYEPCTSYRCSCYFDPCTCRYQQVCCPVTTYRLRSQCCPVTSYLQRCCLQPVTTYRQMTYYEPQTTCCTTTIGAPVACPPSGAAAVPAVPAVPPPGAAAVPAVPPPGVSSVPGGAPPPGVSSVPGGAMPPAVGSHPGTAPPAVNSTDAPPASQIEGTKYNPGFGTRVPRMPSASESYRQPRLQAPVPVQPVAPRQPGVRFERIAALPEPNTEGRVVRADRLPQGRTQVLFVSTDPKAIRQSVTTDEQGRFQTILPAGTYHVYVQDTTGRLVYQQRVQVGSAAPPAPMTLVSR
jgi:hypothetical protein